MLQEPIVTTTPRPIPIENILIKTEIQHENKNEHDAMIAHDLISKFEAQNVDTDDLRQLFKYLRYCLEYGILNQNQISMISNIFENEKNNQLQKEEKKRLERLPESKIKTNILHVSISYFIWNTQGNEKDPTLYGNMYRRKIQEVF